MKKLNMFVNANEKKSHINREIYGHFSEHLGRCIYNGIYVGEDSEIPNTNGVRNDIIEAFKEIKMPVLRWPGGCFADEYHWKDGIGDKSDRKKMVNTHWGGVTEDNSFGTHEFFNLCEEIGCEPYLAGNLGSGTVQELSEWIEYITFDGISPMADLRRKNGREKPWKLKYLGIGNENWGCGGGMRPEYYADEYRRYQTYCRNFSGNELYKIACGPNVDDYSWTEKLISNLNNSVFNDRFAKAITLHYYTTPINNSVKKGSATNFTDEEYYTTISHTLYMDELIRRHLVIMDRLNPSKDIDLIVDEWGCWYDVEPGTNPGFLYQQNTMRDAIVAACNLNIFNSHSDRVAMANIAQAVNVLQALILTDGKQMLKTPTYHVFDLYKTHQDGELVESFCENDTAGKGNDTIPAISQSVSVKDSELTITIANCSIDEEYEIECNISGFESSAVSARILNADVRAYNDFESTENVVPKEYNVKIDGTKLIVKLPKCSVVSVIVK